MFLANSVGWSIFDTLSNFLERDSFLENLYAVKNRNREQKSNPYEIWIKILVKLWKFGKNITHILSLNLSLLLLIILNFIIEKKKIPNYLPTKRQFVLSLASKPLFGSVIDWDVSVV